MNKFYTYRNKDSADAFIDALTLDGFREVAHIKDADFILYDVEGRGWRRDIKSDFLKEKPGFIYPHTPLTCYIWDEIYEPLPVACNFVAGEWAKECMKLYGYPYRVETIGFPRCNVIPFQPAKNKNLLFVPARPNHVKNDHANHDDIALQWIIQNRELFDHVLVCRIDGQFPNYINYEHGIEFLTTNPKGTSNPALEMIARIDKSDIVIAVHTPAALAVARGKPTIMYAQDLPPETVTGKKPKNFSRYKHLYSYPMSLEKMTEEEFFTFISYGSPDAELWKMKHIGGDFNKKNFLDVIKEYV